MSRIPVSTLSPSHPRALQEPLSFPTDRAVSPAPSSRHNSVHSAPMTSLSGHASSTGGKKLSKRALGDEVSISLVIFFKSCLGVCALGQGPHWHLFLFVYAFALVFEAHSSDRHCGKELNTGSPASEPYQPPNKVVADVEENLMLPRAPWQRSSPAQPSLFPTLSPSRKQVNSVQPRGPIAFLS